MTDELNYKEITRIALTMGYLIGAVSGILIGYAMWGIPK